VRGKVKGEMQPREFTMWLRECFPRNSTLWALRPEQQICYTAVRAFANIAAAGLLMGMPFDTDSGEGAMIDVTPPRPTRERFENTMSTAPGNTAVPEETTPIFGHPEARELGRSYRDENRPMSPPHDLDVDYHETFLDGWRGRDEEIRAEGKKK
jgi:hypothetical protein